DNRAVGAHDHCRTVRHHNACASIRLRLDGVTGIELRLAAYYNDFARRCMDDLHVTFEGHEPRTRTGISVQGNSLQGIPKLPNIQRDARRNYANGEYEDRHVHGALLHNPPIKLKMAAFCHHEIFEARE